MTLAPLAIKRALIRWRTDVYVVSFPKSGRTWLRVMLAKALSIHFGLPYDEPIDPQEVVSPLAFHLPYVVFVHDGSDRSRHEYERCASARRRIYRGKKVVLLVRDPRDVVVSWYFHRTRRFDEPWALPEFIRDVDFGIDRVIDFMNDWLDLSTQLAMTRMLLRYEDLCHDTAAQLERLLHFLGLSQVSTVDTILPAVEYASMDNMRSLARRHPSPRLRPARADDPRSHKVREGRVQGYAEHCTESDVAYMNGRMRRLRAEFGYGLDNYV